MEEIIYKFCFYLQLNVAACNSALMGAYTNSNVQKEYNASKSFADNKVKVIMDDHKTVVYTGVALGAGYEAYKKKEVTFSTPLKPFADSFSADLTPTAQTYHIDWKFQF